MVFEKWDALTIPRGTVVDSVYYYEKEVHKETSLSTIILLIYRIQL